MSVERWSNWLANLDPVIGSEQGKTCPVLTLSETSLNDILPVVNVVPITSPKPGRRIYPNETFLPNGTAGLTPDSLVLCYQVRTLDKRRRLQRRYGKLNDAALQEVILTAFCFQLGITR